MEHHALRQSRRRITMDPDIDRVAQVELLRCQLGVTAVQFVALDAAQVHGDPGHGIHFGHWVVQ